VQQSDLAPAVSTVRVSLHILAATIWVGGQFTIAGLVGPAKSLGADAPKKLARAFSKIEWPAFAVLIATGIWNVLADDPAKATSAWRYVMMTEVAIALLAGLSAYLHQIAKNRRRLALFGALSGIFSLTAVILGVLLAG